MEALYKQARPKLFSFPQYIIAVGAALLLFATAAYADGPYTMAPPIQPAQDQSYGPSYDTSNVSSDTVFNWNEVPESQQVPIVRAVFDQGGYQLYDSVGETIVVPFTDNNLYVMQFAVSPDDTMYFINDGDAPVLYVPRNGYLENATVPGAKWYPFSEQFHPDHPVFIGCAPSWDAFVGMGWYPGMICHGGFWCGESFWDGGIFVPTVDLIFVIGGHRCDGWHDFDDFCDRHPDFDHIGFFHRDVYRLAERPHFDDHPFMGGHPGNGDRGFSDRSDRVTVNHPGFNGSSNDRRHDFNGSTSRTWNNDGHSGGFNNQGSRTWNSDGSTGSTTHHVFQGAGSGWNGNRDNNGNGNAGDRTWNNDGSTRRVFQGGNSGWSGNRDNGNAGGSTFEGQRPGAGSGRTFRGGDTGNSGSAGWDNRSFTGGQNNGAGSGRTFHGGDNNSGGSSNWGGRTFGSQSDSAPPRTFGGGDRSFGGGSPGWSGRSGGGQSDAAPARTFGGGSQGGWSNRSSGGSSYGGGDRSYSGGSSGWSGRSSGGGSSGGERSSGGQDRGGDSGRSSGGGGNNNSGGGWGGGSGNGGGRGWGR